jgi:hypothetical protein
VDARRGAGRAQREAGHTAILAGSSVIVWGGRVGSSEYLDTGAASLF